MKKTFVSLASSKCVEDATSEHCNKKDKQQTSSMFLILLLPLPSPKNDEKQLSKLSSFQHIIVKSGHFGA
jgi:hypothetical protein